MKSNKKKMARKRMIFYLTWVLSIFIFLAGCGSSSPSQLHSADSQGTETVKEDLILAVGKTDIGMFDPKKGWGTHAQIRLTHSSLLTIDSDLNFIGDLAESYTVSEDALTWTFPLRNDVKFSNGELVTAEDVKFTYEMLKEDGIKFDLSFVESIEAVPEDNTVVIRLLEPRSTFVSQLTEIGIVPEAHYDDNYSQNPIGSGPYQVVQYDDGQQIIMEYNPYWYGKEPQFKKLTLLLLEEDAALAAAKAGQADIVYVPPTFAEQKVNGMQLLAFESIDSRGIMLPTVPSGGKGRTNDKEVDAGNDVTSDLAIRMRLISGWTARCFWMWHWTDTVKRLIAYVMVCLGLMKKPSLKTATSKRRKKYCPMADGLIRTEMESWKRTDSRRSLICTSAPATSFAVICLLPLRTKQPNSV